MEECEMVYAIAGISMVVSGLVIRNSSHELNPGHLCGTIILVCGVAVAVMGAL